MLKGAHRLGRRAAYPLPMGRIVVSEFMTLDGVMEAPGHDEHRDGKNAWALRATTEEQQRFKVDELFAAGAILLGRVTYQIWAAFWPDAPKDDGFADRINGMEKCVVSTTLREPSWNNTTVIRGDLASEIPRLKGRIDEDIVVYGSADLVDSLMQLDLVDELRILLFPIVLGSGKRLFRDERDISHLRLVGSRTFASGVVLLTYEPSAEEPTSEYVDTFAWTDEQIASWQAAQDADRVLASVLFTDVVDSTGRAAAVGDRRWRQMIDRHDRVARAEVERFGGRLIKTTGDGILATFDAPTRALRCALAMTRSLDDSGLGIRAAIHTGEIVVGEEDIGGIGVHIAARLLAEAGERQVVVTRTVRDLATGSDLAFSPLGAVSLRGVPGEWELFEASTTTREPSAE
jgi:class 3 adenylate cyclase/dihydrofolate reductase